MFFVYSPWFLFPASNVVFTAALSSLRTAILHASAASSAMAFGTSGPGLLLCRTGGMGQQGDPPPLKVYSECPEGRRFDGLLLSAPQEGRGLSGQHWAFGAARHCVGWVGCFSSGTGWHMTGCYRLAAEWEVQAGRSGYSTPYGTIIWVTERGWDGPGLSCPLP